MITGLLLGKFECLLGAVCKAGTTAEELEVAWSKLSAAEVQELTREGGKLSFNGLSEFSPLHQASLTGQTTVLEFLLVSSKLGRALRGKNLTKLKNPFSLVFFCFSVYVFHSFSPQ